MPVLIVGGGAVGLTASILLSRHGARSLLVERHPGTSVHPKARAINVRTMEIYRHCGVEHAIRESGGSVDELPSALGDVLGRTAHPVAVANASHGPSRFD